MMKKLLMADSLNPVVEAAGDLFSMTNTRFHYAASAEELLKIHKVENADLIIADLDMPGMNGDELCSVIRKDNSLKKVSFAIVCDDDNADIERCRACKVNAYITRPVDKYDILRNIKKLLYVPERRDIRVILHVLIKGESDDNDFFANSHNISTSGILFDTKKVLKVGENIKCTFYIDTDQVAVEGLIVRYQEEPTKIYYYGMQFTKISPIALSMIEKYVQQNKN